MKTKKINLNSLMFFTGLLIVWLASHSWIALLGALITRVTLEVGKHPKPSSEVKS